MPEVDSERIVVAGTSGGGYPAQLACLHATPKPAGLLLLYGLGCRLLVSRFKV
jgi:acetyl esterase/lipase